MAVEQVIHREAITAETAEIAEAVQSVLGQRLAALVVGVRDAKAVGRWARGERAPHPQTERHLRDAYAVMQLILREEGPETTRAWFMGVNPDLDDQAPALILAEDPGRVVKAARAFIAYG